MVGHSEYLRLAKLNFIRSACWHTLNLMIKKHISRSVRIATIASLALLVSACSSVSYYSQSVVGHSKLMLARQSVDKVVKSAEQPLKAQLLLSKELKDFSVHELGLPESKSYNSYVDLQREFPVWTVVATPEFSLTPKHWCYLVIGCASYRGYFKRSAADKYAAKLQSRGFETEVGGASAYSTLGWFKDPLLPSMMRYGDIAFAETLFHEIAHQQLYINGDSDFNEAFASLVGEVGVVRWLELNRPQDIPSYQQRLKVENQFYALVEITKDQLIELYASGQDEFSMRMAKQEILKELLSRYENLKETDWKGKSWYKTWFDAPLNNAKFSALSTYQKRVPELRVLLEKCEGDLSRFYQTLSTLKAVDRHVTVPAECSDG